MNTSIHKIFLVVYLLLYSLAATTQNHTIDSLKKVLESQKEDTNKVVTLGLTSDNLFYAGNFEKAVQYSHLALALAKKLNFKKGEAEAYTTIGLCYAQQYNWTEAMKNYVSALKSWQELGDKSLIGNAYILIASIFNGQNNYPEALKNVYSALKSYEAANNRRGIARSHLMIGLHHFNQEENDAALTEFIIALKLQQEMGDELGSAQSYGLIGQIYFRRGNYEEALKNDSASLKIYQQLNEKRGIANIFASIGEIYEKQGEIAYRQGNRPAAQNDFNEANINYLKALKLSESEGGSKMGLGSVYVHLGNINTRLKKFAEAKTFLDKGRMVSEKINDKESLRDNYLSSSILDSVLGNFSDAYKNFKIYILYRDSLINAESISRSLQLKLQYEFDKKEAITQAEQDKKDADTTRIKNRQTFTIVLLGVVAVAVVIIALIQYKSSKQKQKANNMLIWQKEKVETALSELKSTQSQLIQSEKMASLGELTAGIAHEIQNPLNFVNNFSDVNKDLLIELKEEADKGNLDEVKTIADDVISNEEKINHHGKRADAIVKGMLQHSRTSTGKKEATDINALADEYLRLAYHGLRAKDKSFSADFKTGFDASVGMISVVPQDVGRVLLNLVNNAFYAVNEKKQNGGDVNYQPTVTVSTKKLDGKVEIRIADNGNGIPQNIVDKIFQPFFTTKPTGQGTGLGLSLAYDTVKAHGGELKVDTTINQGTVFSIVLPKE